MEGEEEKKLTKREKRELAKEEKAKVRAQEAATQNFRRIMIGIVVVVFGFLGFKFLSSDAPSSVGIEDKFVEYAVELGLDEAKFREDFRSNEELKKNVSEGVSSGNADKVESTPSLFLNGELVFLQDEATLMNAVDSAVASGEPPYEMEILPSDRVKGGESAKVTLMEYGDFQCPACANVHPLVKEISEKHPDDLRVVYRHFPLIRIHKNAFSASVAAEAAGLQDKFWEMHDILYERQKEWANL